jgi:arylsulfatase
VASTLDIFPTLAKISGGDPPKDLVLDGADLAPLLWEGKSRPQRDLFYYHAGSLRAIRRGPWKLHITGGGEQPEKTGLYQLETDIAEQIDVASSHPEIVSQLREAMTRHQASFQPAPTQR